MLETRIRHVQRHIMVFYSKSTRLAELIDRYRLKLDDGDEGIITIDPPRRGDYPNWLGMNPNEIDSDLATKILIKFQNFIEKSLDF